MSYDYWEERFIEEHFISEDYGINPRLFFFDNILSQWQMIKDHEWVVENLRKLNTHTKLKRMNE